LKKRYLYHLNLSEFQLFNQIRPHTADEFKNPTAVDTTALAELMIDAYNNTIDYDGETVIDAVIEVESFFGGRDAKPMLKNSWLCLKNELLASACLVGWWEKPQAPLISYIMTGANWKNQGMGTAVLNKSIESLVNQGFKEVYAVITDGNKPSERIFEQVGFVKRENNDGSQ